MSDTGTDTRPSWDVYFMDMAKLVASRSTCLRRKVGAIAVKDKHVLSSGYNGAPARVEHCITKGCLRAQHNIPSGERHELCRGVHAEQNVIASASYHGISLQDATLYCTTKPCIICMKMLINSGITTVIYEQGYADLYTDTMAEEANITMINLG